MAIVDGRDAQAVADAAALLAGGGLVAFPTETVYGLGARADRDDAVARVFAAKGRPIDHPLIVHVADEPAARAFAAEWPADAKRLAAAFWPGPLTLIVRRKIGMAAGTAEGVAAAAVDGMAAAAAGGLPTIALRCPAHPVAQALLRAAAALGVPGLAAPSANRFGRVSPTTAAHVIDEFGSALHVLDGGACEVGIESAIVDCSRGDPVLLRPGGLSRAQIESRLARPLRSADAQAPRAPGSHTAHYAPQAALALLGTSALRALIDKQPNAVADAAIYSRTFDVPPGLAWAGRRMPGDAGAAARELFAVLRDFDRQGARRILVEALPDDPAWEALNDRLRRAEAGSGDA
jgi:L-threonylcarbamoyladenylate synthase